MSSHLTVCPKCDAELELDTLDLRSQRYTCPECGAKVRLYGTQLLKDPDTLVRTRRIPVRIWDRTWYWISFLITTSFPVVMIVGIPIYSFPLLVLPCLLAVYALYQGYRAAVCDQLTFFNNPDPIERKIDIIMAIAGRYKWKLSQSNHHAFFFLDWTGQSPHEILIICTEEGYYINRTVRSGFANGGVAVLQTLTLIKKISQLSVSAPAKGDRK